MKFVFPKDVEGYLTPGEGRLLFKLAQVNPELGRVVELGAYHGRSTICLAQGSKKIDGGMVFTVDTFEGGKTIGKLPNYFRKFNQNIKSCKLNNYISAIQGNTVEVAKSWKKPIRLLFIDASHFYDDVLEDYQSWEKYVVPDGIIAFHDSEWAGVYKVICQLLRSGRIKNCQTLRGHPHSRALTYGYKVANEESISWFKRYQAWLRFKYFFLPYFWVRFKGDINERGELNELDLWFRIFGTIAGFLRKIKAKLGR